MHSTETEYIPAYYNPERDALEKFRTRDPEEAMARISDTDFHDFVGGVGQIAISVFEKDQPEVLLTPLRGAQPIVWTLEAFAQKWFADEWDKKMPFVARLPLGTTTDVYCTEGEKGLTKPEKNVVIGSYLETLFAIMPNLEHMMIIDEAASGGTLSYAAHVIQKTREDLDWNGKMGIYVARDPDKGTGTARFYSSLMRLKYSDYTHVAQLKLPAMDVSALLPMILKQDPAVRSGEAAYQTEELLEYIENQAARKIWQERVLDRLQSSEFSGLTQMMAAIDDGRAIAHDD